MEIIEFDKKLGPRAFSSLILYYLCKIVNIQLIEQP